MVNGFEKLIAYYVDLGEQPEVAGFISIKLEEQRAAVRGYANGRPLLSEQVEHYERKRKRFPVLDVALRHCKQVGAKLIIPQMQNLTRNEGFTSTLLKSGVEFVCLDQPLINNATLPALVENFKQMRLMHSARIRRGLEQTVAQLGNPNALKEITKVNKPKTENAVLFALILEPMVSHYRGQGYSQRKMVEALNEEGFVAPEGGQWVLSQLQKVLERIDVNIMALNLAKTLEEFDSKGFSLAQKAKALNAMKVSAPGWQTWDETNVQEIIERYQLIAEILSFNRFMLDYLPELAEYQNEGLTDEQIADRMNTKGISVPERIIWELRQEELIDEDEVHHQWEAQDIEILRQVGKRRIEDMDMIVYPNTLGKAIQIASGGESEEQL